MVNYRRMRPFHEAECRAELVHSERFRGRSPRAPPKARGLELPAMRPAFGQRQALPHPAVGCCAVGAGRAGPARCAGAGRGFLPMGRVAAPPQPCGSAAGLGLRTRRGHVVLRPGSPGRALCARCGRAPPPPQQRGRAGWSATLAPRRVTGPSGRPPRCVRAFQAGRFEPPRLVRAHARRRLLGVWGARRRLGAACSVPPQCMRATANHGSVYSDRRAELPPRIFSPQRLPLAGVSMDVGGDPVQS